MINHSEIKKFSKSFESSDLGFRSKKVFFLQFWVDILDPDPGSQNLAVLTDPDPKHWF